MGVPTLLDPPGAGRLAFEVEVRPDEMFPVPPGQSRRLAILRRVCHAARHPLPEVRCVEPAGEPLLRAVCERARGTGRGDALRPPGAYAAAYSGEDPHLACGAGGGAED